MVDAGRHVTIQDVRRKIENPTWIVTFRYKANHVHKRLWCMCQVCKDDFQAELNV